MKEKYRNCIHGDTANIPYGDKSIEKFAFMRDTSWFGELCYGDKEIDNLKSVIIPETVIEIEAHAFSNCTGLKYVSLPRSLTTIGPSAFWCCTSLEHIIIPENVSIIHDTSFAGCSSIDSIEVSPNNLHFSSQDNCLLTKDKTELILGCKNSIIPKSVKIIRDNAFYGCTGLQHIDLPNKIITLGKYCFSGCTALDNIEIPISTNKISRGTFEHCKNLSHIEIPSCVSAIEEEALLGCESLKEVRVSEHNPTYTSVNNCILSKNGKVLIAGFNVSIIPVGVSVIEAAAFKGLRSLNHVDIPNTVEVIKESAFESSGLQGIVLPNSVTQIGASAFDCCKELTSVKLSTVITVISTACFRNCSSLIEINLPLSIKVIEPLAFMGCENLPYFYIHEGVTMIGYEAFSGCKQIRVIEIPNSLKSTKTKNGWERCMSDALHRCSALEIVRIKNTNPEEVEFLPWAIEYDHRSQVTIEVPIGTGYAYRQNPSFKGFKNINAIL